ncbi:hypothetical protein E2L06_04095 [Haloterrigena sp. H1]|uniref:hypothetical protein n=1 Tax=Haloterrigena sp. H1 TaxID=2552943 RepID=UPI00110F53D7|nr:hypothetical protein [Haloterrigena sp. H1]TMT85815.1 hypothetical protein E2L06_04095 [Haloterrigena sp. H1]
MEIDFENEGGCVDMATGTDARTKLEIFRTHPGQIRLALESQSGHGEMSLGVGLTADEAHTVGEHLIELAEELEEESEEEE